MQEHKKLIDAMTDKNANIITERLVLRRFTLADASEVQRLAGDKLVAATTLNIPHPYENGMAEEWISTHLKEIEDGKLSNFAITLKNTGQLIGAVGLHINKRFNRAELGYWVGVPYWNKGYCTEAARAMIKHGLEDLKLHRIFATHFVGNDASGRVMQKTGMKYEGLLRQHVCKDGQYYDLIMYSILNSDEPL